MCTNIPVIFKLPELSLICQLYDYLFLRRSQVRMRKQRRWLLTKALTSHHRMQLGHEWLVCQLGTIYSVCSCLVICPCFKCCNGADSYGIWVYFILHTDMYKDLVHHSAKKELVMNYWLCPEDYTRLNGVNKGGIGHIVEPLVIFCTNSCAANEVSM